MSAAQARRNRGRGRSQRRGKGRRDDRLHQAPIAQSMNALRTLLMGIESGTATFSQQDTILRPIIRANREESQARGDFGDARRRRKGTQQAADRPAPRDVAWQRRQDVRRARAYVSGHSMATTIGGTTPGIRAGSPALSSAGASMFQTYPGPGAAPPSAVTAAPSHVSEWRSRFQSPLSLMLNAARRPSDPLEAHVPAFEAIKT